MFFEEFRNSLSKCGRPDVFLFAGDMMDWRSPSEYDRIVDSIEAQFGPGVPIVACSGNEEARLSSNEVIALAKGRVKWLDNDSVTLEVHGIRLGIIGAPAPLRRPTAPEVTDSVKIGNVFESRSRDLSRLIENAASSCDCTILLMHYSPLRSSGADTASPECSWWISRALGRAMPDLIIHGHVHTQAVPHVSVGEMTVANVAFPAIGQLSRFTLALSKVITTKAQE